MKSSTKKMSAAAMIAAGTVIILTMSSQVLANEDPPPIESVTHVADTQDLTSIDEENIIVEEGSLEDVLDSDYTEDEIIEEAVNQEPEKDEKQEAAPIEESEDKKSESIQNEEAEEVDQDSIENEITEETGHEVIALMSADTTQNEQVDKEIEIAQKKLEAAKKYFGDNPVDAIKKVLKNLDISKDVPDDAWNQYIDKMIPGESDEKNLIKDLGNDFISSGSSIANQLVPGLTTVKKATDAAQAAQEIQSAKGAWNTTKAVVKTIDKVTDTALSVIPGGSVVTSVKKAVYDIGKYSVTKIIKLFS